MNNQLTFLEKYKLKSTSSFQFNNLSDCFDYFDEDNDKQINVVELQKVIKYFETCSIADNIQLPTSEDEISNLMSILDVDGNGTVERQEFIDWLRKGVSKKLFFNDTEINDTKLSDEENQKVNNFYNIILNSIRVPHETIENYITTQFDISDNDSKIKFRALEN